jgi:hypothetical protein
MSFFDSLLCWSQILCKGSFYQEDENLEQEHCHLVDDMFWNMGFKTETQADKDELITHVDY